MATAEIQNFVAEVTRDWVTTVRTTAKKWLLRTQLFTESDQPAEYQDYGQGIKVALVWGILGLLITVQTDWILGQIINQPIPDSAKAATVSPPSSPHPQPSLKSVDNQHRKGVLLTSVAKTKSSENQRSVFNASGFTQDDSQKDNLAAAPLKGKATSTAILLAARSQMPSFNARQLDEQIALYKQRLAKTGTPPQVLIIGSSRALRGVDPAALSQALATQGYPNIDVFNLGINGATAQVVDFIIRRVLQPSELPKLILWADGSRAFNSGRDDITFKAIAASAGYKQALQTAPETNSSNNIPTNPTDDTQTTADQPETNSYEAVNDSLNQIVAAVFTNYQYRDQIKTLLHKQLNSWTLFGEKPQILVSPTQSTNDTQEENIYQQAVDFDGFLPLSTRFNPLKYYQKHPRVPGNYDNDYKSFQVGGEQDSSLQALLRFTQEKKITLVFVNMPLTGEYLDSVRKEYEQQFQQYMLQMNANPNFIYRDFSQLWPKENDYFSDPSHLNRFGAYEVSKKLAYDPMIPWSVK